MIYSNNIKPKYGIFTMDREFADDTIDSYVQGHNCPISKRVKSEHESFAFMEDGTEYKWVKPIDSSRGHRCTVGVIDLATCDIKFIKEWIPHICLFADAKKDYVFYDSLQSRESKPYDLHTLIDRLLKIEALLGNIKNVGYDDSEFGKFGISCLDVDKEGIIFSPYY